MRPPGPFLLCPPRYTKTFPLDETLNDTTDTVIDLAAEISAHLSKLVIEKKCPSPTPIPYSTPSNVKVGSGGPVGKEGSDRSGAVTPESSLRGGTPLSIGISFVVCCYKCNNTILFQRKLSYSLLTSSPFCIPSKLTPTKYPL